MRARMGKCGWRNIQTCTALELFTTLAESSRRRTTPPASGVTQHRQRFANGTAQPHVSHFIEGSRLSVDDDDAGPCLFRGRYGTRDRIDLQARADREQTIGLIGRAHGALDHLGNELLTERNRVALEDAVTGCARRIRLARPHAIEHALHGSFPTA